MAFRDPTIAEERGMALIAELRCDIKALTEESDLYRRLFYQLAGAVIAGKNLDTLVYLAKNLKTEAEGR